MGKPKSDFIKKKRKREQIDFLSITLNSIGDGVIVTDKKGKIIKINKVAQNIARFSQKKAKRSHISEVFKMINSKTGKIIKNPLKKIIREGKHLNLANDIKLITKTKQEDYIVDIAANIKDEAGEICGIVFVLRNVKEKCKMRQEIKNKSELFTNAVEESPFSIMLHNDNGEVLKVNQTWQELTGYSEAELPTIDKWLEKAYGKNLDNKDLKEVYNNIKNVSSGEFKISTKKNEQIIWDIKNAYLGLDEDDNKLFISMAVDVTEKKQLDKKIEIFNRIYQSLSSINQLIVNENSLDRLLKKAVQIMTNVAKYDTAWIAELSDNKELLNVKALAGYQCSFLNERKVKLNYGKDDLNIYKNAILKEEAVIIDVDTEKELKGKNCGSTGIFVLKVFDKIWGLLVFCSQEENRFDDKEYALLEELTTDISFGIEKIISNSKQKEYEAKLTKSEKEYRQLVQESPIGIYKTNFSGKVLFINSAIVNMLGFNNAEDLYVHYKDDLKNNFYVNPNKRREFLNRLQQNGVIKGFVCQVYDKNNNIKWIENNARISSEKQEGSTVIEGFISDITERKKRQEKIAYLSLHDDLTGLYNRSYLEDMMKRIDTKRNLPISIIMVDINNFKIINDTYSHSKGDELLKKTAELLNDLCRQEDVVARWGGDEFVILLPDTSLEQSETIIERINVKSTFVYKDIPISLALGAATKTEDEEDLIELLNTAEDRMYTNKLAKRSGGRSMVVSSFLNTLKEKSHETEEHVNRMSIIAEKFAKRLNLSKEKIDRLALLSLLHDIGKVSVPEKILNKVEKLTDEEWEIIKSHPEAGYRILVSIPKFSHIAKDVLYHHERWDGSGYPEGLKGKKTPLLSRVLTIIDSYDVMVSGRPYKKAMSQSEALAEIKRCSGTQFDPELAQEFIKMLS
ncbi:sensor domain-containing diguanylate cyclase/phosphohydrolase [Halanaerobium hydrogeniformans]|uniref:Diguanylate cyclase and metal dependent phosphohydrolase n=1 Tax=Halanaerobium hydrogeniformans TaxID=656519 RepID=E4RPI3_HALHG|nr:HD domain-containing phosphohydrolase [Halanaerobium hydrogeniformans]ADQ14006.1 diguanylate cyclase and metal dependent phosphohydrolase [Halanaerobium hydrogeniformans]